MRHLWWPNENEHWSHVREADGLAEPYFDFFLLHLQTFCSPRKWNNRNEMNCSSPGWTVGGFCFPNVRDDIGFKEGKLQLAFKYVLGLRDVVFR